MISVNLLPWRAQDKTRRLRYFFIAIVGYSITVFSILSILGIKFYAINAVFSQTVQDKKITRQALQHDLDQLVELQQKIVQQQTQFALFNKRMKQIKWVNAFFLLLEQLLPESCWLQQVEINQSDWYISGKSHDLSAITEMSHRLQSTPFMTTPQLTLLTKQDQYYIFKIKGKR